MIDLSFAEFVDSLTDFSAIVREDQQMRLLIDRIIADLHELGELNQESLARYIERNPQAVPVLAMCAGLGQEQLKNQLKHRLGTSGWTVLAKTRAGDLVTFLNTDFGLIAQLQEQLHRQWNINDVLMERHLWSRRRAVSAVGRGRNLEDEVEAVVERIGLTYVMRTTFIGRGGASAPCDLAIPAGGENARIVVAIKSFNSTGSKLSDAVREIEKMTEVRTPNLYIFAVIDGIGWKSRQSDLQKIYTIAQNQYIDGLYNLNSLANFERDLIDAAVRLNLLNR